MFSRNTQAWTARFLIGFVLFFNVQCALAFLLSPSRYAPGFALQGVVGDGIVRGMGVLFLMWNVPYLVAFFDPIRFRVSLYEAVAMQGIGFTGETLLLATMTSAPEVVRDTILRFITFDAAGLVVLVAAAWMTRQLTVLAAPPVRKT